MTVTTTAMAFTAHLTAIPDKGKQVPMTTRSDDYAVVATASDGGSRPVRGSRGVDDPELRSHLIDLAQPALREFDSVVFRVSNRLEYGVHQVRLNGQPLWPGWRQQVYGNDESQGDLLAPGSLGLDSALDTSPVGPE